MDHLHAMFSSSPEEDWLRRAMADAQQHFSGSSAPYATGCSYTGMTGGSNAVAKSICALFLLQS